MLPADPTYWTNPQSTTGPISYSSLGDMGWSIQRMAYSAVIGGCVGAGGVIAGSIIQVGRMPPKSQVGGAAAMMATVLGVGSVVRS